MGVIALSELPWRKVAGAVAVVVLHVAIIMMLLNATIIHRIFRPEPKETILLLQPLPKPEVKPQARHLAPPAHRIVPAAMPQNSSSATLPRANGETSKAPSGLGYQLYDCQTANLPKLTAEQRAACAKAQVGPKQD